MRAPVLPTFLPPPRRRSIGGLSASALLHGLLLLVIISPWFRRYHWLSAEGSDLVGTGGGGGGGGERYIALPALREQARQSATPVVPPVETPAVPPPTVTPTEIPPPTPAPDSVPPQPVQPQTTTGVAGPGSVVGQGGGAGGGTGGGQGTGIGAGAGPGPGGSQRGTPPENRQMLFPPLEGTPRALRGKSLTVRFYVNTEGRVDRVETVPVIEDRKFAGEFDLLMKSFRFRPARDSLGGIVAGIALGVVTLSNH